MIKMNSYIYCVDNTGVANAKVIQMYGNKKKRVASYRDMVYVVIKSLDKSSGNLLDEKQRKKYKKGSLHRAIIVHTKRVDKIWKLYKKNLIVIVEKVRILSRRIRTLIPREVAFKYPTITSVSSGAIIVPKKVIKRYYTKSSYNLVKITDIAKLLGSVGQKFFYLFNSNVSKVLSEKMNSQVKNDLNKGFVKEVKINGADLTYFETIIKTANHKIDFELSNEEMVLLEKKKRRSSRIYYTNTIN